jgi:hypothetical protein
LRRLLLRQNEIHDHPNKPSTWELKYIEQKLQRRKGDRHVKPVSWTRPDYDELSIRLMGRIGRLEMQRLKIFLQIEELKRRAARAFLRRPGRVKIYQPPPKPRRVANGPVGNALGVEAMGEETNHQGSEPTPSAEPPTPSVGTPLPPRLLPKSGPQSWRYATQAQKEAHLAALDALPPKTRQYARTVPQQSAPTVTLPGATNLPKKIREKRGDFDSNGRLRKRSPYPYAR